jgi:hypothetical protein
MDTAGATCTRCGHYPVETISATWQKRAAELAADAAARARRKREAD